MNYFNKITPKLLAFDLDGTLLTSKKELSSKTIYLLQKSEASGIKIAFASGRIKSSIDQYSRLCPFPVSILSLNGAEVYSDIPSGSQKIFSASLPAEYADYLIEYSLKNKILMNYYYEDTLYAIKNEENLPWISLYYNQTRSTYNFVNTFQSMKRKSPSKIIFIGTPDLLDRQQNYFTKLWGDSVYICRTWDYYLEFLNPMANKGSGLSAIADFYSISQKDILAMGDAMNDIPMLEFAGFSIAVRNAGESVKMSAKKVSEWSNDEEAVAKELEQLF